MAHEENLTRRSLLKGALGGAAAATLGAAIVSKPALASGIPGGGAPGGWFDWERFLVERLTMGFTLKELVQAKALGYHGYLEYQLAHAQIDDSLLENLLASEFVSLAMSPAELWDAYARTRQEAVCVEELKAATVLRSVYSKRQLFERMCDLWNNHFNLDHGKVLIMATTAQREVVRKHALAAFPDLLEASAHSAAMMCYLDNGSNVKAAPNENYARELMELHTMGVRSGYTETDVKEVARCMTGWAWYEELWYGQFEYYDFNHDQDRKHVLGHPLAANGGRKDGEWVVRELGQRHETGHFIARKLLHHFFSEEPSDTFVDKVAHAFHRTGGDLKEMVRTIFDRRNIEAEGIAKITKFKRPNHFQSSLLRALEVTVERDPWVRNRGDWMVIYLYLMGQAPFAHTTPDGYSDAMEVWGTSILPRWRFASDLIEGAIPSAKVDLAKLEKLVGKFTPATATDQIDWLLTGGRMSYRDKEQLREFIERSNHFDERILREAIALGAQSPSFQVY
jgi:uncharacterized protein (DUF1800 family)